MKVNRLLNTSLIALLTLSMIAIIPTIAFAGVSPNSPADAVYIVPAQVIYSSDVYCTYNNTKFTITVIAENFAGVAGIQIKIDYNTTLLAFDVNGWTFDTGSPMSPTQMAPSSSDRVDTNASVPGSVQIATVWKSGVTPYTYAGNSTMATIKFQIIYCPEQQVGDPGPDTTVSCVLDNDAVKTKCVDTNGDDIFFTYVGDGYYEYTTKGRGRTQPIADFVWSPGFPTPSDTVTLTDQSDANGVGDFITKWQWVISGPATVLYPYTVQTTSFDYYVTAGYMMVPTAPAPAPDPAGFDITFYSSYNGTGIYSPAPVYNFGNLSLWGGRVYLFNGVESAPSIMGAAVDVKNLLGLDINILDLTVKVSASTPVPDATSNASMVMVETLDQWDPVSGNFDECNYGNATYVNGSVVVKRQPELVAGLPVDRFAIKVRDPPSYPEGPGSLVEADKLGDAAVTGHVAPIALGNGGTFRDYFGPVIRSDNVGGTGLPLGAQIDGTLTFELTWTAEHGPTMQFHCDAAGDVSVTLTVWDNEGLSASVTKTVPQTEKPAAFVDLWTSGNRFCGQVTTHYGKGFGEPCDAISPDVNVTFYALVTWGGAPLAHRLVGFEIVDNQGNNVVTRTAETDKQGVARIWWRMPLMNPPDQIFGVWNATVSVKVQDVKIYDYMAFKVGWVVTITGKWEDKTIYDIGNPDGSATDGDYIDVTVQLKNIMMMPKEVYLAITIYDDCDVPILKLQDSFIIDPEFPWCNSEVMNVTLRGRIPHWAYVGIGKVYANVYTAPPFECGTPYSPEFGPNLIQLVWTGTLFNDP